MIFKTERYSKIKKNFHLNNGVVYEPQHPNSNKRSNIRDELLSHPHKCIREAHFVHFLLVGEIFRREVQYKQGGDDSHRGVREDLDTLFSDSSGQHLCRNLIVLKIVTATFFILQKSHVYVPRGLICEYISSGHNV